MKYRKWFIATNIRMLLILVVLGLILSPSAMAIHVPDFTKQVTADQTQSCTDCSSG